LVSTIEQLESENAALRAAVEARLGAKAVDELVALPADVPADYREKFGSCSFRPAESQRPAEFQVQPVAASLPPEQLEAIWGAAREKAARIRRQVSGEERPEPIAVRAIEAQPADHADPYSEWIRPGGMPRLIGLTGPAGCGKNLVASMIPDAVVTQLADPLYAALSVMLGIPEPLLRHRPVKEQPLEWLGKSPRQMLQTLGTDWGRTLVASDIWLQIAERRCRAWAEAGAATVVICDVRFPNEAEWIRSHGGEVWFVDRCPMVDVPDHESEAGLPEALVDWWIDNSGRPEQTREAVIEALARK
jgi:hypothetical protein